MTEAQTYYLRRPNETPRPAHKFACPFYHKQVVRRAGPRAAEPLPRTPPDGFFAVLKPLGEHLAQRPDDDEEPGSTRPSIPQLARLLWQLSELAGTNTMAAIEDRAVPTIKQEFAKLKSAAQQLFIAPGVPLAKLLFTHPSTLHSKLIYAQLRPRGRPLTNRQRTTGIPAHLRDRHCRAGDLR